MGATIADLARALDGIAPARLAAEWDNVGLLLGARDWPVAGALLAIDLTQAVLDEAVGSGAGAIVAYHPPIFRPLRDLTADTPEGAVLLAAAAHRIAILSPHTALDAAAGGLGDWLAAGLGAGSAEPLEPALERPDGEAVKIVTMAPPSAIEALRGALAAAGAGRIGAYEECSFELRGEGTFLGGEASNPVVGRRGALERVGETRLEMVCSRAALAAALRALRAAHPYEEPPVEVHPLDPRPRVDAGQGRLLALDTPVSLSELVARAKARLGTPRLRVAAPRGMDAVVRRVGLCPGAGGELLAAARRAGCDAFLTGEMRHHDVLAAANSGCAILLAGHTNTERPFLPELAARLGAALAGVRFAVSVADRWPLAET